MRKREQYIKLWDELSKDKPLILVSGPRQSGKTTLARQIQKLFSNSCYINWDILTDKRKFVEDPYFFQNFNRKDDSSPLIIFDEIHKYNDWKNYIKGVYDEFSQSYQFLVTGSGRLNVFQKAGDSLAGRYFLFHLFPFTISELAVPSKIPNPKDLLKTNGFSSKNLQQLKLIWKTLFDVGGFPEPFLKGKKDFFMRWTNTYIHQIIHEDIRVFADVKNINNVELLYSLLPSKVGNPFSMNSVARDLNVSFDSVKTWLNLLETVYLTFPISPWTKKISRAILREKKWYLYNYAEIADEGARFENMIALELLRLITYWNDEGQGKFSLHYVRNKDKKEVDFLIAENNKPILLIESKLSDQSISKNLLYFQAQLNVPAVQLVNTDNIYKKIKSNNMDVIVMTAYRWLAAVQSYH